MTTTTADRRTIRSLAAQDQHDDVDDSPAEPTDSDARYDYVECPSCGGGFQRLDFYSAPHLLMCACPRLPEE